MLTVHGPAQTAFLLGLPWLGPTFPWLEMFIFRATGSGICGRVLQMMFNAIFCPCVRNRAWPLSARLPSCGKLNYFIVLHLFFCCCHHAGLDFLLTACSYIWRPSSHDRYSHYIRTKEYTDYWLILISFVPHHSLIYFRTLNVRWKFRVTIKKVYKLIVHFISDLKKNSKPRLWVRRVDFLQAFNLSSIICESQAF